MNNTEKVAHAHAIAHALGGSFSGQENGFNDGNGKVTLPDGVTFWLSVGGWSGADKVHVGTSYPQHYTGANRTNGATRYLSSTTQRDFDRTISYSSPTFDGINLTTEKTPEQAAKDIKRRFLPIYAPLYAQAVEYCTKQVEYLDAWDANYRTANAAARDVQGMSVDYIGRDGATFRVSVPSAHIEALAEFLKGLNSR